MKVSTKKKRTSTVALIALLELKVDDLRRRIVYIENKTGIGWKHEFVPAVDEGYAMDPTERKKYKMDGPNSINVV